VHPRIEKDAAGIVPEKGNIAEHVEEVRVRFHDPDAAGTVVESGLYPCAASKSQQQDPRFGKNVVGG